MKKLITTFFALALFSAVAFAQEKFDFEAHNVANASPKFQWEKTTHDFGKINQDNPVGYEFKFKNTGNAPLVISEVKPSCGCTIADYTHEPIAPGAVGYVKTTYNAKSVGTFHKSITITANVEGGTERLLIKGEVLGAQHQ